MSDARASAAQRAFAADPSGANALALVTAWLRSGASAGVTLPYTAFPFAWLHAGGRDPRKDPRFGDMVEARQMQYANRSGYRPRRWTVVRPTAPGYRDNRLSSYEAAFEPTTRASRRLVRRWRTGAESQVIFEVVTLESWRRWARAGVVIRVACPACEGRAGCSTCDDNNAPCCACFGTGHALPGIAQALPAQPIVSESA